METASDRAPAALPTVGLYAADAIAARRTRVAELLPVMQSTRDVAAELGVSQPVVWRDARALGLDLSSHRPGHKGLPATSERRQRAAELYEQGASSLTIAAELGVSKPAVLTYLRQAEVELRPPGGRAKYPQPTERLCANKKCKRGPGGGRAVFTPLKPSYAVNGRGDCCCHSCGQSRRWQRGRISLKVIQSFWKGSTRRKYKNRVNGLSGGHPGRPPELVTWVRNLERAGKTYREIADITKISKSSVGNILKTRSL